MAATEPKQTERTQSQKISTFLMFSEGAAEAVDFYVSVFKNSKILNTMPGTDGKPMGASFILDGQEFQAYNGGPHFKFAEGISLFVKADTQAEIDELYDTLSEGGEKQPCGWLKDQFGVSWQIIPPILGELLADKDRAKADRVVQAMIKMHKIDIQGLTDAAGQ
ncbi:MAG: VOC family protein [Pyrinomonadaceae bacterium]